MSDTKKCTLCFDFSKMTKEQIQHLANARHELIEAGVYFDTGYDVVKNVREWQLD